MRVPVVCLLTSQQILETKRCQADFFGQGYPEAYGTDQEADSPARLV